MLLAFKRQTELVRSKKPVYAVMVTGGRVKIERWSKDYPYVFFWREPFTCLEHSCSYSAYPCSELWDSKGVVIWSNKHE